VAIYSPNAGDVVTVFVKGTSVTTAARQFYALAVSGSFYSAVWYCQSPFANRTSTSYTTLACGYKCQTFTKSPICCNVTVGATCASTQSTSTSLCDPLSKPDDCSTSGPTRVSATSHVPAGQGAGIGHDSEAPARRLHRHPYRMKEGGS
jgi:hypothetical protein